MEREKNYKWGNAILNKTITSYQMGIDFIKDSEVAKLEHFNKQQIIREGNEVLKQDNDWKIKEEI